MNFGLQLHLTRLVIICLARSRYAYFNLIISKAS